MSTTQHQFPVPSTYNYQSPAVGQTRGSTQGTTTLIGQTRTPQSYSYGSAFQQPSTAQNTVRGNTQTTVPYTFQQTYLYQYPFTYPFIQPLIGNTRSPFTYDIQTAVQGNTRGTTNATGQTQTVGNSRVTAPYPFTYIYQSPSIGNTTGQTRFPFTYPYRSPAIGVKEDITATYPYIANKRGSTQVNAQNTVNYVFQQPSIVQATTNGSRPIGQVAEVKGVFFKDSDGVVKKTQEVYFKKDSSTVEKIHQTIPISQMNK